MYFMQNCVQSLKFNDLKCTLPCPLHKSSASISFRFEGYRTTAVWLNRKFAPASIMSSPLIHEKVWFEKNKYDEAERLYYENLVKGSPNTPNKISLAGEVAKARQHIKHSLECMDGIAALATTANVEVGNRVNLLEKDNAELKKCVEDLKTVIGKLQSRIDKLESQVKILDNKCGVVSSTVPCVAAAPKVTSAAPTAKDEVVDGDDANVDLFGSDSEEESDDAKKLKEARLAAYAAKKAKKPALIAKSNIILDVKPWDDETDMSLMEKAVRAISTDGLLWGASKLVPLAYGIHKLQISCVVEDEKVSVDWLQENIESIEDYVQSVDIAAFNKV